jgi:hypothetical protein
MRRTLLGALLGTLLVFGLTAGQCLSEGNGLSEGRGFAEPAAAVMPSPVAPQPGAGNLITHVLPSEGGPQAVVVVDPSQHVMAVYHVDKTTGEIALRSVRNITWDLQMLEFNSGEPLPQDIRNMRGELER